jgi:hypothetical protein
MFFKNLTAMLFKPHYKNVYLFPAGESLVHIPDSGSTIVTEAPVETPDGETFTFTFSAAPKYVMHNGTWLVPNLDYTVLGSTITLTVAPVAGAVLRAVI